MKHFTILINHLKTLDSSIIENAKFLSGIEMLITTKIKTANFFLVQIFYNI